MILEKLFAKKEEKMQKKRNRAGRKLTEAEWKRIKSMFDAGFKTAQIEKNPTVHWAHDTILRIGRTNSYQEFEEQKTVRQTKHGKQEEFDFGMPKSETLTSFLEMNENKVMFCFDFKSKDFDAVMGHIHALDSLATHKMDRIMFNGGRITRVLQERNDE